MNVSLPRDGAAGTDHSLGEIDVLDLSGSSVIEDPWNFLVSRLAIWVSRYHGDGELAISRARHGVFERKLVSVDAERSVADAVRQIDRCRWQPAESLSMPVVHLGDEPPGAAICDRLARI